MKETGIVPEMHFKFKLRFLTMPTGNSMPVFSQSPSGTISAPADIGTHNIGSSVVDAHSIPGIKMESVVQQVSHAIPIAMTDSEIMLRRQIATKVLITMGGKMQHFEKRIEKDGTVDVDWLCTPMEQYRGILSDETRIKSHAIIRVYSEHTVVQPHQTTPSEDSLYTMPDARFSYLLGCTAIDLGTLLQHSINVNTGKVNPELEREYDFATKTNFCNTFSLCTVLPLDKRPSLQEIQAMQQRLDIFKGGVAAYDSEISLATKEGREPDLSRHMFMSSELRHLPDVEKIIKLQQGLQKVYFVNGIKSKEVVLSESNSLAYASTATCLQLHGMPISFQDMSRVVRERVAHTPVQQLAVQMHSAMCSMGLSLQDMARMKKPEQVFDFVNATVAASIQDAKQTPYKSDYILHSVTAVKKEVAEAQLQPIPGTIEYAPGCNACFYRKHDLGTGEPVYCRYNLQLSEDLRQIRTGRTLDNQISSDDCETNACQHMSIVNTINETQRKMLQLPVCVPPMMQVGSEISNNRASRRQMAPFSIKLDRETVDTYVCPKLFAGHTDEEREMFCAGMHNILTRLDDNGVYAALITGNAEAPAAGGDSSSTQASLNGHCYCGMEVSVLKKPRSVCPSTLTLGKSIVAAGNDKSNVRKFRSIVEGTKWVDERFSSRAKKTDAQIRQLQNQNSSLLFEITKIDNMDPKEDIGSTKLYVDQDKPGFYACAYVYDDKILTRQSVPGVKSSPLALGAPVSYFTYDVESLRPIHTTYNLVTQQLHNVGFSWIGEKFIYNKIHKIAKEDTVVAWDEKQWDKNVFSGYIPCSIQYEDSEALKLATREDADGEYCSMMFTHESAKNRICLSARPPPGKHSVNSFVETILSVLHDGAPPPITKLHAKRILDVPVFTGMNGIEMSKQLKTFDANKVNSCIQGKLKGLIRVARISTQMGCISTLCLAKRSDMQTINDVLMTWAKPILAAQQLKTQVGLQWRINLETNAAQKQRMLGCCITDTGARAGYRPNNTSQKNKPTDESVDNCDHCSIMRNMEQEKNAASLAQ